MQRHKGPVNDKVLDTIIRQLPQAQRNVVSKLVTTVRQLERANATLNHKVEELAKDREETFGLLFVLLRREANFETFITLDELQSAGMMDAYRISRDQAVLDNGLEKIPGIFLKLMVGARVPDARHGEN